MSNKNYQPLPEGKDPWLWELANRRVSFRRHATTYVVVNSFLFAIYFLTSNTAKSYGIFPWPLWSMLGWGIGLGSHYASAYLSNKNENSVNNEYNKLNNK